MYLICLLRQLLYQKLTELINTVKVLIDARALIRTITVHGEGDGHLLEARVLTNDT